VFWWALIYGVVPDMASPSRSCSPDRRRRHRGAPL